MNIEFPYRIATNGRTATTDDCDHVRDMIELLLFTHPGERVMRPDFGTGLLHFVHCPNSPELAAALQLTVQAAISQYLGDVIDVRELRIESLDAQLRVSLVYTLLSTGTEHAQSFPRSPS
ncbi:GPW/gp25 family protein [Pseudomonas sp. R5(2019)]|jgi:phage baseplate assembly protein W|uniref:GPW/gp25 family protein n=1 Tax=Pseudomonas sp. R5(2019) TaxID=2697566 RepID=UPI00141333E7|nr:GPW/gp25 family protein [Pseudomonas sp. R5(2019)]NBA93509.1 hypothetical protein [Pseudomonas sp. R5(2019)]